MIFYSRIFILLLNYRDIISQLLSFVIAQEIFLKIIEFFYFGDSQIFLPFLFPIAPKFIQVTIFSRCALLKTELNESSRN